MFKKFYQKFQKVIKIVLCLYRKKKGGQLNVKKTYLNELSKLASFKNFLPNKSFYFIIKSNFYHWVKVKFWFCFLFACTTMRIIILYIYIRFF